MRFERSILDTAPENDDIGELAAHICQCPVACVSLMEDDRLWLKADETYLKVRGQWMYLYRAIDSVGDTVEFFFSENRDLLAAKRFLRKALGASWPTGSHGHRR